MTPLEDVRKMQMQGASDDQIIQTLRDRGIPYKDIAEALTQTRIKAAVEQNEPEPQSSQADRENAYQTQVQQDMQPSIMNTPQQPPVLEQAPAPGQQVQYAPEYAAPSPGGQAYAYPQQQADYAAQYGYPAAYPTQAGASPDLVTEIAEQIMAEKLGEVRKSIDKVIDLKTTVESRIEYLDERLKRLEKLIDTLQTSVLRKVGDYVTNVQDLKNELIETQKTFTKFVPEAKRAKSAGVNSNTATQSTHSHQQKKEE